MSIHESAKNFEEKNSTGLFWGLTSLCSFFPGSCHSSSYCLGCSLCSFLGILKWRFDLLEAILYSRSRGWWCFYLNSYYLHLFLYLLLWYTLLFFENFFLSQRQKEKSESNQSDGTYYIKRNETNKFVEQ